MKVPLTLSRLPWPNFPQVVDLPESIARLTVPDERLMVWVQVIVSLLVLHCSVPLPRSALSIWSPFQTCTCIPPTLNEGKSR